MHLKIYTDGASWGNPGPAAIGAVIKDDQQKILAKVSRYIGDTTNNQAEYQAVIAALKEATKFRADLVTLYLDSELVAKQLAGSYKVKNIFLFPLHKDGNSEAHALAQAALKKFAG
jgi:ribonuclease HI